MSYLSRLLLNLKTSIIFSNVPKINNQVVRTVIKFIDKPKPGTNGKQYRRIVHFPINYEYTVKPLDTTHLAGRDPVTGRVVAKGIGGGIKHKYHWIQWVRDGPAEGQPQIEKVLDIIKCGCRTADVALVAVGDELKYILATENMKIGDLLKTSRFIPRIPVRAKEGDAYPLGALSVGTQVHCLEKYPGHLFHFIHAAGTYGTIQRKFGDHVVVQMPTKREYAFLQTCMATVGRVSNIDHGKTPIGSAQKNRELGNRPRSGWWQRKTGKHGRKIKRLPPMRFVQSPQAPKDSPVEFTLNV
ncbi:unnamed protein product [Diamesa hyperborea]